MERLLVTTDRQDAATANLRSAAYEALMEMIKNSPKDCYEVVKQTIMVVLDRLQQVRNLSPTQYSERILDESAKPLTETFTGLMCMLQRFRI